MDKNKENYLLSFIPDEAWNALMSGKSTLDVIYHIRSKSSITCLIQAKKAVDTMRLALGMHNPSQIFQLGDNVKVSKDTLFIKYGTMGVVKKHLAGEGGIEDYYSVQFTGRSVWETLPSSSLELV